MCDWHGTCQLLVNRESAVPRSVLIVEDEEILLRNLTGTLVRAGVEVSRAASIAEARRQLAARQFALICIDIRLGDGDGIELISAVSASSLEVAKSRSRICRVR